MISRVSSGFPMLDELTGGFQRGQLTVWTGDDSGGKSSALSMVLLNALGQGEQVCVYSGELSVERFRYLLDLQAHGPHLLHRHDSLLRRDVPAFNPATTERVDAWYGSSLFMLGSGIVTDDEILRVFAASNKLHNCKTFAVDSLITVQSGGRSRNFVSKLKGFAQMNDAHVHLVVHSSRIDRVMGLADNVVTVHRLDRIDLEGYISARGHDIPIRFDPFSKRIWQADCPEDRNKQFGWMMDREDG